MKKPLVSIIIVTYNSGQYIETCLKSVLANSYSNFEVLIFDNNSDDETLQICKKYLKNKKLRIVKSRKNLGFALGNNLAIKRARGEYIFILNPDTIVQRDFLKSLVSRAESNQRIVVCQPLVYLFDKKTINLTGKVTHFLGFDWLQDFKQKSKSLKSKQIYSFSGSGVLIRKRVFELVRGFDNKYFMYYEDSDLSWRLNLLDYKIFFEPKSVLYHDYKYLPQEDIQPLKKKLFYIERNRLMTVFKNYSVRTLLLVSPILLFMESGMVAFAFYEGWGMVKLRTYSSIWGLRGHILKQRRFIQSKRAIKDNKIIKNFENEITFEKFANPIVKIFVNPILKFYFKIIRALI